MKVVNLKFKDEFGNPLSGAKVYWALSQDSVALNDAQIAPAIVVTTLDSNGIAPQEMYFNDELTPPGTFYSVTVVRSGGGVAWGPENVSLSGTSPLNFSTVTPTSVNVLLPNPVLQNPTATQTITGFDLAIVNARFLSKIFQASADGNYNWSNTSGTPGATADTSLSRFSPGIVAVGNGTQGDFSGTLKVSNIASASLVAARNGNNVTLLNEQGPQAQLTGNATDQVMYTYTMPGNTLAAGKGIKVSVWLQHSQGNASVTYRVRFGGTTMFSFSPTDTSTVTEFAQVYIFNNSGVTNAQHGNGFGFANNGGSGLLNAPTTSAIDTTSNVAVTATFNTANTDKVTPAQFIVELIQ